MQFQLSPIPHTFPIYGFLSFHPSPPSSLTFAFPREVENNPFPTVLQENRLRINLSKSPLLCKPSQGVTNPTHPGPSGETRPGTLRLFPGHRKPGQQPLPTFEVSVSSALQAPGRRFHLPPLLSPTPSQENVSLYGGCFSTLQAGSQNRC